MEFPREDWGSRGTHRPLEIEATVGLIALVPFRTRCRDEGSRLKEGLGVASEKALALSGSGRDQFSKADTQSDAYPHNLVNRTERLHHIEYSEYGRRPRPSGRPAAPRFTGELLLVSIFTCSDQPLNP